MVRHKISAKRAAALGTERHEMLHNKIPPPLVAALFAVAMWALAPLAPTVIIAEGIRLTVGVGSILVGIVFATAGVLSFRQAKTTVNPLKPASASSLVDSGVYRLSRNPMYFGLACFLLAWACALPSLWSMLGVVGFMGYMGHFQIGPEERALKKRFGDDFRKYKRRVRRWI